LQSPDGLESAQVNGHMAWDLKVAVRSRLGLAAFAAVDGALPCHT
jgi:hypothetical protein